MSRRPRKAYHPHGRQNHHHQSRDEPPQRPPLLSALLLKGLWLLLLVMFGNTPDVEELIKLAKEVITFITRLFGNNIN